MRKHISKNEAQNFIRELKECKAGREHASLYEKLCCRILRYLFPNEFFVFSEQCPTHDGLYRMDLQVALNGKAPFWRFLKNHFQSRYVVFEFKDYSDKLDSSVVDGTKKYYCRDVMRNVIFLVSRKGFDPHAKTAAIKTIRDSQLMVELTDSDLIEMLNMKQSGQDPSLHLMRKVDLLLMGFSA